MAKRIKIGVIGGGACDSAAASAAEEVGRRIAEAGAILICGGRGGVMEAACRGAQRAGGLTVGILPTESESSANPYVDVSIPTGLGQARNFLNVFASHAVIAIGGEYGTLSEIAIALKAGVPVIGIGTWTFSNRVGFKDPVWRAASPEEAVRLALNYGMQGSR